MFLPWRNTYAYARMGQMSACMSVFLTVTLTCLMMLKAPVISACWQQCSAGERPHAEQLCALTT